MKLVDFLDSIRHTLKDYPSHLIEVRDKETIYAWMQDIDAAQDRGTFLEIDKSITKSGRPELYDVSGVEI